MSLHILTLNLHHKIELADRTGQSFLTHDDGPLNLTYACTHTQTHTHAPNFVNLQLVQSGMETSAQRRKFRTVTVIIENHFFSTTTITANQIPASSDARPEETKMWEVH